MTALNNGTDFLTPGCGIAPRSPLENLLQIKKARDDFSKKLTDRIIPILPHFRLEGLELFSTSMK